MHVLSQTATLFLLSHLHPEAIDALKPHLPAVSERVRNLQASAIIKSIAGKVGDPEIAKELHQAGRALFNTTAGELSYDTDEIFHTNPRSWYEGATVFGSLSPSFSLGDEVALNPQPLPPHERAYYGAVLTLLAGSLRQEPVAAMLRNTGAALLKHPNSNYKAYSS